MCTGDHVHFFDTHSFYKTDVLLSPTLSLKSVPATSVTVRQAT